jgi:anti-sigma factor RsiW
MAMTHADAASTQAVERYLLGELSSQERDDFEAHAFDCPECAEDLRAAALFLDASRAVMREDPPLAPVPVPAAKRSWRSWRSWLQPPSFVPTYAFASAFVLLLGFSLYQNVVTLPALRNSSAPRALSAFSFVSSGTRGATPLVIAAPARQPFLLFFDIPPGGRHAAYHCAILTEGGTSQLAVDVTAAQARDTVQLFVPAGGLAAGPHTLVITGRDDTTAVGAQGPNQEIARYPFVLQGRD